MKATLPRGYKDLFTINELKQAKNAIKALRDDPETAKEYAKDAATHYCSVFDCGWINEPLTGKATVTMNRQGEYNAIGTDTGYTDVMIEGVCQGWNKDGKRMYVEIAALLSDIWRIGDGGNYTAGIYCKEYK